MRGSFNVSVHRRRATPSRANPGKLGIARIGGQYHAPAKKQNSPPRPFGYAGCMEIADGSVHDYLYPFLPDIRIPCHLERGSVVPADMALGDLRDHSLLLAVRLEKTAHDAPTFFTALCAGRTTTQYLEPGRIGLRYLELSEYAGLREPLRYCTNGVFRTEGDLLAFRKPVLRGPILVIAPHPDDAEIAAFGLYCAHPERTTIVTITAGDSVWGMECEYIAGLDPDLAAVARRKGLIRSLDAVTAPRLGGISPEAVIVLGYFDDQLHAMHQRPDAIVAHRFDPALSPRYFRRFNQFRLTSDPVAQNGWKMLVADLAEIVSRVQPQAMVMPHPEMDSHPDHRASALAVREALVGTRHDPEIVLYYVNHLPGADEHPFGPPHCTGAPGPWSCTGETPIGYLSQPMDLATQKEKVCALELMHDLRCYPKNPTLETQDESRLHGEHRYGKNIYFQTAIKTNELFFVAKEN